MPDLTPPVIARRAGPPTQQCGPAQAGLQPCHAWLRVAAAEALLACDPALAAGRAELVDPDSLLPGTESSIVGGVISLATHPIVAGGPASPRAAARHDRLRAQAPIWGAERAAELAAEASSP